MEIVTGLLYYCSTLYAKYAVFNLKRQFKEKDIIFYTLVKFDITIKEQVRSSPSQCTKTFLLNS